MAFSWKDIKVLADLSRLELSPEDGEGLAQDLSKIVDYVSVLDELSTDSVSSLDVIEKDFLLRDDELSGGFDFDVEESSHYFPHVSKEGFIVPKVKDKK